jgi:DNA-binding transcriptional LysR family regulator
VSFEHFATANTWRFRADGNDLSVAIRPRLVVNTAEAAIDAAISGVGITCVLSYQVEVALRAGSLQLVLQPFEPAPIPVSLLYSSQGRVPLKVRALLDFAAPRLRKRLLNAAAALNSPAKTVSTKRAARKRR